MAHVVVVGAGVVGLSVARSAARRGHAVTMLDQDEIPNPRSASFDQHRMIRPHYGAAEGYTRMVRDAIAAWEEIWRELGERHFIDTGAIAVSTGADDYGAQSEAVFRRLDHPHRVVSGAALEELCGHLALPSRSRGIVAHPAGPLFADRIVTDLARLCEAQGVRMMPRTAVATIEDDAVRTARGERISGDLIAICAGAWLPAFMPERFGRLPTWRQALCYVEPPAHRRADWESAPSLVTIGDWTGYTLPPLGGAGLKFGHGGHLRRGAPTEGFAWEAAEGRQVIDAFRPYLRDPDDYRPLRMQVGYYVKDQTRRFQVEKSGRCLFVTNCDGQMFKFAPLIGEKALAAFAGEMSFDELSRWAAGRS